MINFFLLAWDPDNPKARDAASQLIHKTEQNNNSFQKAFQAEGLIAYAQALIPNNLFPLANNAGVILGRLFRKTASLDDDTTVNDLSAEESRRISDSRGDYLTECFWGSYVAILPRPGSELLLGRDCSGLQLCFTRWENDVFIAFSNLDSLPFLDNLKKEIDWSALAAILADRKGTFAETGLNQVYQLAAGEYAQFNLQTKEVRKFRSWKPEEFTSDLIENPEAAKRVLRQTVLSVVKAQSRDFNKILLMLSGGLDSSILLACLRKFHPPGTIRARHLHSMENDVSERHYAQSMADMHGIEMEIEELKSNPDSKYDYASYPVPPWPVPADRENPKDEDFIQTYVDFASDNIDGIFKGQGGDQIFFQHPAIAPLYDYKKKHAFDPNYYKILLNTARLTESSVWKLQRISHQPFNRINDTSFKNSVFLSKDMLDSVDWSVISNKHPWLQEPATFSFGKSHQLQQFTHFNQYAQRYTLSTPQIPSIPPLIAQPLMETMLRIPTHILLMRGRNRGLAREAFRQDLTLGVYNRESKGNVSKSLLEIVLKNLPSIREVLYDGILTQHKFLDRGALDSFLNEDGIRTKLMPNDIHHVIRYERWARSIVQA